MATINLEFLPNNADEGEGLGDAGIETYMDSPYASMAREIGQNSSDAGIFRPVVIDFDLLDINIDDLPAPGQLLEAIQCCLEEAEAEKEIDFFSNAESLLKAPSVKVLRAADFNTTGLIGPCISGTPFHALVKSSGVNNKQKDDSGGSFGIGKNAAFSVSATRSVFYSTLYDDGGKKRFLFQGKSLLTSHKGRNGKQYRSRGYWGGEGYEPIEDIGVVPEWIRRDELGTSVFSVGFLEVDNWQYQMALSLIMNFFVAIHRGEMKFRLNNNEIEIDKDSLSSLLKNDLIIKAAEDTSQKEDFEYVVFLYECLTSEEAISKTFTIPELGQIKMMILSRDDLPKRLTIIRNGMVITDSLDKFGDKFSSFRMYRGFVALVEPLASFGSALIKRLENSRHDSLSPERITQPEKKAKAVKAMRKLAKTIREAIKAETLKEPERVISLDELAVFFANPDDLEKDTEADHNPEFYTYSARIPKKPKSTLRKVEGGEKGGGKPENNGGRGGSGKRNGEGKGNGSGSGGSGADSTKKNVSLNNVRNVIPLKGGEHKRSIWFTPDDDGNISIAVFAAGINSNDKLVVAESSLGEVINGEVVLSVNSGQRCSFKISLTENFTGPIELLASKDNKKEVEVDENK